MEAQWNAVEQYFTSWLIPDQPVLEEAIQAMQQAGLPAIQISPAEGQLLSILARSIKARTILEIGTLGGYSAIWLARTLPIDGKMVTLEANPKHADVARANIANAGLSGQVQVRVGPALDHLPNLLKEFGAAFDFVFIDADKPNNKAYFEWAVKLTHPGSMIIIDNVVRSGEVANLASRDSSVQGVHQLMPALAAASAISAAAVQTVGSKGYDGFAICLVGASEG